MLASNDRRRCSVLVLTATVLALSGPAAPAVSAPRSCGEIARYNVGVIVNRGVCGKARTVMATYLRRQRARDCGVQSSTCPTRVRGYECRLLHPGEWDRYYASAKCDLGTRRILARPLTLD